MINEPMRGIVQRTIKACAARDYFKQANWEGELRRRFGRIRDNLRKDKSSDAVRKEAEQGFKDLDKKYKTRATLRNADLFIGTLMEELDRRNWLDSDPPTLLADTGDLTSADLISAVIPAILTGLRAKGRKRDYSLLTKFLYFLYPETFPIYDARAACSIQEWAYFSFREKCGEEGKLKAFSVGRISNTDGSGYKNLVEFYSQFWAAARPEDRLQLQKVAKEMEDIIGGRVTILDLVDKLLWTASGNPVILGLLD